MSKTKVNYRELDATALTSKAVELERQVQELRLKLAAGKLDKPSQIRILAHELARVKTELRYQQLTAVV